MDDLPNVPDGYLAVRSGLPRAEAVVVQGLLQSNGIPAPIVAAPTGLHTYTRAPSSTVSIYVPAERLDEAKALLLGE